MFNPIVVKRVSRKDGRVQLQCVSKRKSVFWSSPDGVLLLTVAYKGLPFRLLGPAQSMLTVYHMETGKTREMILPHDKSVDRRVHVRWFQGPDASWYVSPFIGTTTVIHIDMDKNVLKQLSKQDAQELKWPLGEDYDSHFSKRSFLRLKMDQRVVQVCSVLFDSLEEELEFEIVHSAKVAHMCFLSCGKSDMIWSQDVSGTTLITHVGLT